MANCWNCGNYILLDGELLEWNHVDLELDKVCTPEPPPDFERY